MQNLAKYAKAIVAILGAVLTAVVTQFPDNTAVQQWGPIVSALLTAVGVYVVPNARPILGKALYRNEKPTKEYPGGFRARNDDA